MAKYTTIRSFYFLILAAWLTICSSFAIEANSVLNSSFSIKISKRNDDVNVVVKAPKNTSVQFYMFSTDGSLVKQLEITGTEKFNIGHLTKGIYLYELFNKDKRLKRGNVQIK